MANTTDLDTLRNKSRTLMPDTIRRCKTEIKYNPPYVVAHMADHDGVETAIWLVSIPPRLRPDLEQSDAAGRDSGTLRAAAGALCVTR